MGIWWRVARSRGWWLNPVEGSGSGTGIAFSISPLSLPLFISLTLPFPSLYIHGWWDSRAGRSRDVVTGAWRVASVRRGGSW